LGNGQSTWLGQIIQAINAGLAFPFVVNIAENGYTYSPRSVPWSVFQEQQRRDESEGVFSPSCQDPSSNL
jgi:hypothetical protein